MKAYPEASKALTMGHPLEKVFELSLYDMYFLFNLNTIQSDLLLTSWFYTKEYIS